MTCGMKNRVQFRIAGFSDREVLSGKREATVRRAISWGAEQIGTDLMTEHALLPTGDPSTRYPESESGFWLRLRRARLILPMHRSWNLLAALMLSAAPVRAEGPVILRDVGRQTGITFQHTDDAGRHCTIETVASGVDVQKHVAADRLTTMTEGVRL